MDKENRPDNTVVNMATNKMVEPSFHREMDYASMIKKNLVFKKYNNDKTLKVVSKKATIGHNRNLSTGSILQLKEVD